LHGELVFFRSLEERRLHGCADEAPTNTGHLGHAWSPRAGRLARRRSQLGNARNAEKDVLKLEIFVHGFVSRRSYALSIMDAAQLGARRVRQGTGAKKPGVAPGFSQTEV
jgi:hypothetical protein